MPTVFNTSTKESNDDITVEKSEFFTCNLSLFTSFFILSTQALIALITPLNLLACSFL
jgi:hypothetical protein